MNSFKYEVFFKAPMTTKIEGIEQEYTHGDTTFFVHNYEKKLIMTKFSIQNKHLIIDYSRGYDAIRIDGSNNLKYLELLKFKPSTGEEIAFNKHLNAAINQNLTEFYVLVCDPSISEDGKLQFVASGNPATNLLISDYKALARTNNMEIACRSEYVLFISTLMLRVIADGYEKNEIWHIFCNISNILGNYTDMYEAKPEFSKTGSIPFYGKCDLTNTCKLIRCDDYNDFEQAGGFYRDIKITMPVARIGKLYNDNNIECKRTAAFIYRKDAYQM